MPIDYDQLAAQHGAVGLDYDALAAQHGGISQEPAQKFPLTGFHGNAPLSVSGTWEELKKQGGKDLINGIKEDPIGTTTSLIGHLFGAVAPGGQPGPGGEGAPVHLSPYSDIESARDIAERGPNAVTAAGILSALGLAGAKFGPKALKAGGEAASSGPGLLRTAAGKAADVLTGVNENPMARVVAPSATRRAGAAGQLLRKFAGPAGADKELDALVGGGPGSYAALPPEQQAIIQRIKNGPPAAAPAPPYVRRPPEYYGVKATGPEEPAGPVTPPPEEAAALNAGVKKAATPEEIAQALQTEMTSGENPTITPEVRAAAERAAKEVEPPPEEVAKLNQGTEAAKARENAKRAARAQALADVFEKEGIRSDTIGGHDLSTPEGQMAAIGERQQMVAAAKQRGVEMPADAEAQQKVIDAAKAELARREAKVPEVAGDNPEPLPPQELTLEEKLQKMADDAMARIKARGTFSGTKLNMGVPVDDAADWAVWGAAKIAKGTVSFSKWSAEMVSELGEQVRPQLQRLYQQSRAIFDRNVQSAVNGLPNTRKLMTMYHAGEDGAGWYTATKSELAKVFGKEDGAKFVDFLAATSPNASVKANFGLALKAYRQWKAGEPFEGYLGDVKENLKQAANEEDFGGLKVQSFRANLHGAPDPVTVDRWINKAFGYKGTSPTPAQYKFMDATVTQIAKERGIEPRAFQAAVWKAIKEAEGDVSKDPSEPFESHLASAFNRHPEIRALLPKDSPYYSEGPFVKPKRSKSQ